MQPPTNIDEFLTGLLDGNLSESELRQVEAAMAADSTLEKQLETLRKMRSDLLAHRPKGRLGADFAKRVTAMAEARARDNDVVPSAPIPASGMRIGPWIYSGAVSAAVIAFVLAMMPSDPTVQPQNLTAGNPVEVQPAPPGELPQVGPLESQLKVAEPLIAEGTTPKSNSATTIKELEQANSLASVSSTSQVKDSQKKDFVGIPTGTGNDESPKVTSKPKGKQGNEQILNDAKAKLQAGNLADHFYVMVVDVSISQDAIENGTLESILSRHDIASTEEQVLTTDELSKLEKTGLANKASEGLGEVGLIFVRAPATNLDNAIREINQEQLAFPDFRLGMQFDDSLKSFVKELSQIRVVAERKGEARYLRSDANSSLMSFSSGSIEIPRPKKRAEKSGKAAGLKADLRTMSNALLIIRAAK